MNTSAQLIGEPGQQIFMLSFQPESEARAQVVYLPPFAEEMNRCRALVAAQARQFVRQGYGCTLFDYRGTGDSDGELPEVNLAMWMEDIDIAVSTVAEAFTTPVVLWGVRTGALLAWQYAGLHISKVRELLLWQPVVSGQRFTRQLIRQRIAAGVGRDEIVESSDQIKTEWQAMRSVEIGGYPLGGKLMLELEALEISPNGPMSHLPVNWLEHVATPERPLPVGTEKLLQVLQQGGHAVAAQTFSGAAIWQLNERDENPGLLKITSEIYS